MKLRIKYEVNDGEKTRKYSRTFSNLGYDVILSMLSYMISVILGLAFQLLIVYMLLLTIFVRVNPFAFLKKYTKKKILTIDCTTF